VFNYDLSNEYDIVMTSAAGCVTVDTLLVTVGNSNVPDVPSNMVVPNVWTPNGDGHNDKIMPYPINMQSLTYFRVFNRWGQLMFETKQFGQGWDGIYNGQMQPIDTYVWTAEGVGNDGRVIRLTGNAALIK